MAIKLIRPQKVYYFPVSGVCLKILKDVRRHLPEIKFHNSIFVAKVNDIRIQIRTALDTETPAIVDVVLSAFGREQGQEIADLIIGLLQDHSGQPAISLVATINDRVVGHVLFTSTRLKQSRHIFPSAILAPLSVHSNYQNQGIGGQLIQGAQPVEGNGLWLGFCPRPSGLLPQVWLCPGRNTRVRGPLSDSAGAC
ncbi:MAG: GNAT family N-acetyltransferase [Desulfobacteraceae bacterium]